MKMSLNNDGGSGDHENNDSESDQDSPDVTNEEEIAALSVPTHSEKAKVGKVKQRGKKKSKKSASNEVQLHNDETDEYDEYLKFAMETERHRKERDAAAAAASGDSHKNDFTPGGGDDYEDITEEAANIVVDHERLKKEMSDLFGKDALKVRTYITYVALDIVLFRNIQVHCLETRLELEFTEWRDKHRPVTWPAMPLNMSS